MMNVAAWDCNSCVCVCVCVYVCVCVFLGVFLSSLKEITLESFVHGSDYRDEEEVDVLSVEEEFRVSEGTRKERGRKDRGDEASEDYNEQQTIEYKYKHTRTKR